MLAKGKCSWCLKTVVDVPGGECGKMEWICLFEFGEEEVGEIM